MVIVRNNIDSSSDDGDNDNSDNSDPATNNNTSIDK